MVFPSDVGSAKEKKERKRGRVACQREDFAIVTRQPSRGDPREVGGRRGIVTTRFRDAREDPRRGGSQGQRRRSKIFTVSCGTINTTFYPRSREEI